jgi:hypothetical protein
MTDLKRNEGIRTVDEDWDNALELLNAEDYSPSIIAIQGQQW